MSATFTHMGDRYMFGFTANGAYCGIWDRNFRGDNPLKRWPTGDRQKGWDHYLTLSPTPHRSRPRSRWTGDASPAGVVERPQLVAAYRSRPAWTGGALRHHHLIPYR